MRREGVEIARYLLNPVGKITPELEVHCQRDAAGTLQVAGRSNLPDKTVFEARVYAGQDLVAIDYPVIIVGGRFETRPLLNKGKPFADASYQLRITAVFDNRSQPASVLLVVGPLGERLQGPAVSRMLGTGGAKMELVEEFVLGP
jgi:phosphatidylserine/phosphatidylglycerophosphate/cardiolipin synthase-like enzyme